MTRRHTRFEPLTPMCRRLSQWPTSARQPFRGCKTWRFGDAWLLRSTDATHEHLMARAPTGRT